VDDNDILRKSLCLVLEHNGFEVVTASNVNDALKLIGAETFDVLLSDLQMPNAGDGLTVVSAMRHANPKAVTLILSGYPEMKAAAAAILLQTDEVLTKPMSPEALVETIRNAIDHRCLARSCRSGGGYIVDPDGTCRALCLPSAVIPGPGISSSETTSSGHTGACLPLCV
jgi:DNA-binding NtrC family response regulator